MNSPQGIHTGFPRDKNTFHPPAGNLSSQSFREKCNPSPLPHLEPSNQAKFWPPGNHTALGSGDRAIREFLI